MAISFFMSSFSRRSAFPRVPVGTRIAGTAVPFALSALAASVPPPPPPPAALSSLDLVEAGRILAASMSFGADGGEMRKELVSDLAANLEVELGWAGPAARPFARAALRPFTLLTAIPVPPSSLIPPFYDEDFVVGPGADIEAPGADIQAPDADADIQADVPPAVGPNQQEEIMNAEVEYMMYVLEHPEEEVGIPVVVGGLAWGIMQGGGDAAIGNNVDDVAIGNNVDDVAGLGGVEGDGDVAAVEEVGIVNNDVANMVIVEVDLADMNNEVADLELVDNGMADFELVENDVAGVEFVADLEFVENDMTGVEFVGNGTAHVGIVADSELVGNGVAHVGIVADSELVGNDVAHVGVVADSELVGNGVAHVGIVADVAIAVEAVVVPVLDQDIHNPTYVPVPQPGEYWVFVRKISYQTTEAELAAAFSRYSPTSCKIILKEGKSAGYGYVCLPNGKARRSAVKGMKNYALHGRKISVKDFPYKKGRGGG